MSITKTNLQSLRKSQFCCMLSILHAFRTSNSRENKCKRGKLSKLSLKVRIASLLLVNNHSHIKELTLKYQA